MSLRELRNFRTSHVRRLKRRSPASGSANVRQLGSFRRIDRKRFSTIDTRSLSIAILLWQRFVPVCPGAMPNRE